MRFVIEKEKNWYALINLFWLLLVPNIIVLCIFGIPLSYEFSISFDEEFFTAIITFVVPLLLFDLYILNYIFWQFRGCEMVEMNKEEIIVQRIGKIFKDNSVISLNKIKKIETQQFEKVHFGDFILHNPFKFSKLIGETGGKIKITYKLFWKFDAVIDFGLGLSDEDAKLYVQQMNEIVSPAGANLQSVPHKALIIK